MNTLNNLFQLLFRLIIIILIWTVGLGLLGLFWVVLKVKDFIKKE